MNVRILNAEPIGYSDEAWQILNSIGELIEETVTQDELAARVADVDVLIVRVGLKVTREVLEASNRLRVVVSATTGLNHVDLETAKKRSIIVLSLQGETKFLGSIPATAEHTWALLLSLLRHVPWAFEHVRNNGWNRDNFRGHELKGKNLGILGLGRVGKQVAHYGLAFGMLVGGYDPAREKWVNGVRRFEAVNDILRWSRVLSLHMPLTEITHGFLSEERLRLLPKGAWIVNTSRGAIVDEIALVDLLKQGHIAGAAVDVLSGEQPMEQRNQSPLLNYVRKHDNLLITPHLGGATVESMRRTEIFMAEKLHRFLTNHCK